MKSFILHMNMLALLFSARGLATEKQHESIQEYLKKFHQNPTLMMERLPSEVKKNGMVKPRGLINPNEVAKQLQFRNDVRTSIMRKAKSPAFRPLVQTSPDKVLPMAMPSSDPLQKDQADLLIETGANILRNLAEIEKLGLMNLKAPVIPWTDSYWPTFKGGIARRYADSSFPEAKSWINNFSHVQSHPASSIIATGNQSRINDLSPAEKYDFVMGDSNYSLTRYNWAKGQESYNRYGVVAGWQGICHGWAPAASLNQPIPTQAVTVYAPNGTPVTFYPQDVKALTSMLWATNNLKTRFVGNRCRVSRPKKNPYGRVLDSSCFDPNPATWHVALTNQLGIHKRSFIIDSTFDAQVWNYPLAGAKYRYFNPRTYEDTNKLSRAAVRIEDLRTDPFREFRAQETRYIVGIYMDVEHVTAIDPSHRLVTDNPTKTFRLVYDLELDASYNIVGGEWYSNAHPDFIWTYDADAQAMAREDREIRNSEWNGNGPVPGYWSELARRASSRGQPLYSFIRKINGSKATINNDEFESEEGEELEDPNEPTLP